jgi:pseudaminic acid synthase
MLSLAMSVDPMTDATVTIGGREVGCGQRPYVIAELSANHGGDLDRALAIVRAARDEGADAIKLQTYTADSMTLNVDRPELVIGPGSLWSGQRLHELYANAALPLEWHGPLFEEANRVGIDCFSSPFDLEAVEFLEQFNPAAHKIASFELVDLDLIRAVAATGRPVIMSTGMASAAEIDDAVAAAQAGGASEIVLLRCNSGYPAPLDEMDLVTISDMRRRWGLAVGLSDHTLGSVAAVVAVSLGACVIEKHLTLSRSDPTPDSAFSMEPGELRELVVAVGEASAALGAVRYGPSAGEAPSLKLRRSLWWVADLAPGAVVRAGDLRALRPADGASPKHRPSIVGSRVVRAVRAGDPVLLTDVE